ncbi:hypothetical protein NQZ79_g5293 [Umbelopsis isabellina]|nr:hypothetical protein NQZ79_g5293 [Umbelopsis isabellina]
MATKSTDTIKQELTAALEIAAKNLKDASELLRKFSSLEVEGEDNKRKRKHKDPNAPKRPAGSFFLFANSRRAELKKEKPDLDPKEVARKLGEEWNALDDKAKKPWESKANKAKEHYLKEMEDYKLKEGATADSVPATTVSAPTPAKKSDKKSAKAPAEVETKKESSSESEEKKEGKEHKKHKKAHKSEEKKEHKKDGEKKSKKDKEKKKAKKSKQDD